MLTTLIFTGIIVGVLFLLMAVGVLIGKTSIKGSCGGTSGSCDVCSRGEGDDKTCAKENSLNSWKLLTRYLPFSRH